VNTANWAVQQTKAFYEPDENQGDDADTMAAYSKNPSTDFHGQPPELIDMLLNKKVEECLLGGKPEHVGEIMYEMYQKLYAQNLHPS
jgi:hypothetical protein